VYQTAANGDAAVALMSITGRKIGTGRKMLPLAVQIMARVSSSADR